MTKKLVCVIPARFKSSRFPGKPLHLIAGKPMILHVVENAVQSKYLKKIIVATDDKRIYDVVTEAGFIAQYTSEDCADGSTRVAEVATDFEADWVFEMQGDQPMVKPEVIDKFLEKAIAETEKNNLVEVVIPFASTTAEQELSPDVVKVVVTISNRLIFQTRQPIKSGFRTLGLYLWKRDSLIKFTSLPVSDLEASEASHPIRLYMNDMYVQGVRFEETNWVEVDRPEQILEVEKFLPTDKNS